MATKTSALAALTGANAADGDLMEIVATGDTSMSAAGTNRKITAKEFAESLCDGGGANEARFFLRSAAPSAPSIGVVEFSREAARPLPGFRGPQGSILAVQPSLINAGGICHPTLQSTTPNLIGVPGITTFGAAATAPAFAGTNLITRMNRILYPSLTSASSWGGWVMNSVLPWRGNGVSGHGGWHLVQRFGWEVITATRRWFSGMRITTNAIANVQPSAMTNICAVGQDLADTTIQFIYNDASGTATKVDSLIASPAVGEVLEVCIFAFPGDSKIYMSVEKLNGVAARVSHTVTTNLISATVQLSIQTAYQNVTTASVYTGAMLGIYLEIP